MRINDLVPWGRRETGLTKAESGSPIVALQQEMNRLFDEFWRRSDLGPFGRMKDTISIAAPQVDVAETEKDIEIVVDLPGLDEKDVEVSVTDNLLTVRGEKKAEREERKRDYHLSERTYGSFFRSIPLPSGVASEKATAAFKNGVLTIIAPKTPEAQAKVKKIAVKAA